jgi:SAM-dependent methyltransferase
MISAAAAWFKAKLELPEVRGLDRDSPELVRIHRDLIRRKGFRRSLYRKHYRELARSLAGIPEGPIVEIGSGGGFLKEILPNVITTDLNPEPHLDRVMSAEHLDFSDDSVAAILMLNVFHHLPDPRAFLREAARTLKTGGKAILIEPAHTWLWRCLYRLFSAEPYDENTLEWGFAPAGRFTGANIPLAWIVFERDRERFEREFPKLRVHALRRHTGFLFLLSGGSWYRSLAPGWSFPIFGALDRLLSPAMNLIASQTTYVLQADRLRPGPPAT